MSNRKIKIFGERNTGTNYLTHLLDFNFKVEVLPGVISNKTHWNYNEMTRDAFFYLTANRQLGWKHSAPNLSLILSYPDRNQLGIITLTKNPYSFLVSLYNRPYHNTVVTNLTFSEFLRNSWNVVRRENIGKNKLDNPVILWNLKNTSYLNLKKCLPEQTLCLKFEDLLENFEKELHNVQSFLNLDRKNNRELRNLEVSTKESNKKNKDYQEYYMQRKWKDFYTADDYEFVNKNLDYSILKQFSYELISC